MIQIIGVGYHDAQVVVPQSHSTYSWMQKVYCWRVYAILVCCRCPKLTFSLELQKSSPITNWQKMGAKRVHRLPLGGKGSKLVRAAEAKALAVAPLAIDAPVDDADPCPGHCRSTRA